MLSDLSWRGGCRLICNVVAPNSFTFSGFSNLLILKARTSRGLRDFDISPETYRNDEGFLFSLFDAALALLGSRACHAHSSSCSRSADVCHLICETRTQGYPFEYIWKYGTKTGSARGNRTMSGSLSLNYAHGTISLSFSVSDNCIPAFSSLVQFYRGRDA
ncbi:unnamed protein product [Amoebophrya sp. A120]|nr:unnamed protein product [Amoebophrya sp. A120]|eukprot:GSA120T00004247001.1